LVAPLCREAGVVPVALNFDHAIPGEHSDVDAAFVRDEAARLGLSFCGERSDGIASGGGKSLEMAAREARQAFFRRAAARFGLDAIATGHQADDVAETLLLRLLRGAGAAGLSGLRPRSELPPTDAAEGRPLVIVRPLLDVGREELRDWLRERGISWCEDPSNANEAIPRNMVRRSILPALSRRLGAAAASSAAFPNFCVRHNPVENVVRQLARSAEILREEDAYLEGVASSWFAKIPHAAVLPVSRLAEDLPLALRRRVARMWLLENAGAEASGFDCVETVLGMAAGTIVMLPGGKRVSCTSGVVRLLPEVSRAATPPDAEIPVPGAVQWGEYTVETTLGGAVSRERSAMDVWPAVCTLSAARLGGLPLIVRGRRPGDRMAPFGLRGTKKLQDIFTDAKVSEARRDAYPVILSGDEIVWLPGYRVAAPFAVREGEACVQVTVKPISGVSLTNPPAES
jgi:tRNA(Ile)-lysidine synthetase-like protein